MEYKHWKIKIWEHGKKKPIETTYSGCIDRKGLIDFYGLHNPDVDRYEITDLDEEVCEPYENGKYFKVLKVSRKRLEKATGQTKCVCDNCLASPVVGYYVAVLNRWLCSDCFWRWYKSGFNYEEDHPIETKNYNFYSKLLGL